MPVTQCVAGIFFMWRNFLVLLVTVALGAGLRAADAEMASPAATWIIPQPSSMEPMGSPRLFVSGSERTVITGLRRSDIEWETFALQGPRPAQQPLLSPEEIARAEEVLAGAATVWIRDASGVKEGAVLDGTSPNFCAALFAPGLVDLFEDVFGPEFYVAVPSRFRLYVFPKLASDPGLFAPLVLSEYRAATYPVSQELFEVRAGSIRAVGLLDDR